MPRQNESSLNAFIDELITFRPTVHGVVAIGLSARINVFLGLIAAWYQIIVP